MNFRFTLFCLALTFLSATANAVNNGVWNCRQGANAEWICSSQGNAVSGAAAPSTASSYTPPAVASPDYTSPAAQIPANTPPSATPGNMPPAATAAALPVIAAPAAGGSDTANSQPQPAQTAGAPAAESAGAPDQQAKRSPKLRVHVSENQHQNGPNAESTAEQPIPTCKSISDKQTPACNTPAAESGAAEPVGGSFLLAPAFSAQQESTFQVLRSEFQQDPWLGCQNWAYKKTRIKSTSAADRENAVTDVMADFSESFQGEVMSFAGDVDLIRADQHLRAEKASYDTSAGTMDAQGHVIYSESTLALASDTMAMNLNTDEARIRQAMYIAGDAPLRGYAQTIYRDNKFLSRYNDTAFTSCAPGNQDWVMHASRLKINRETGQGSAKDAWLEFKGAPVLYTPYISFPTDNRRLSGFMAPTWGSTQRAGFYVAAPFYWNIAPNMDSTITPRYFSNRGEMLSNQFRYLTEISKGSLGAEYMPNDQILNKPRYSFSIKDTTQFTPALKSMVDLNLVSDKTYFNDLNNALGFQRSSYLPSQANIVYKQSNLDFSAGMQHYQSVDPTILSTSMPYDVLPRVSFNASHNFEGLPLRIGLISQYSNFSHPTLVNGQRLVVWPSISAPFESTAGFFIPKLSVQSTEYELSNQTVAGLPSTINRTLPIFSLDSGASVEKQVDFAGSAYNNIIEPRLFYLYIPRKNQTAIPIFDTSAYDTNFNSLFRENSYSGLDRLQDANQITVAATTRYLDSVTGLEPLKASIGEILYFQDRTVTLTSPNQPLQTPIPVQTSRTSNLIGEIGGQINQRLSYVTGAQWNSENNSFARGQAGLKFRDQPDRIFDISYRYRRASANPLVPPAVVPGTTNVPADISLADVSFRWPLVAEWYALGRWQYSLNFDKTLESFIGLEKENCCWRLRIIGRRYINGATTSSVGVAPTLAPETAFFVELDLKGLSGLGDDVDTFLQTSLNGYRKAGNY
ncbi:MAG: LPS assembly protein LptD [Methylomonas sp.]|jgi:LPS-assembly protein